MKKARKILEDLGKSWGNKLVINGQTLYKCKDTKEVTKIMVGTKSLAL